MVVFTCNACGDSMKKVQMERHVQYRCRGTAGVSCMDCGADFFDGAFREHVQCVSEKQKYGPAGCVVDPVAAKQQNWMEVVRGTASDATSKGLHSASLRSLLVSISQYPNVPRKRNKFVNFVRNSMSRTPQPLVLEAWRVFEAALSPASDGAGKAGRPGEKAESTETAKQQKGDSEAPTENGTDSKMKTENGTESKEQRAENKALNKRERKLARSGKSGAAQRENVVGVGEKEAAAPSDKENIHGKKKKNKRKRSESPVDDEIQQSVKRLQEDGDLPETTQCKRSRVSELSDSILAPNENHLVLQQSPVGTGARFDWCDVVLSVLGRYGNTDDGGSGGEISLKKLRRKVLAEYENSVQSGNKRGPVKTREQAYAKLDRKLQSMRQVSVVGDRVRLTKH